jgi:hypothetical protein
VRITLPCRSIAFILILGISGLAWGQNGSHSDTGPLPPPPSGAAAFVGRPPAIPFEKLGTQDALMRTIFRGQGPDNTNVEIREVIIGARALVLDPLPGQALVDLRSGDVSLQVGDRSIQLGVSNVISVAAGVPLEFRHSSDVPPVLRIYIVEVR